MKKKIFLSVLLLLTISFISNFYIEQKLHQTFSKIKTENIKKLEHHSNKNFSKNGIENIGENLHKELVKLNVDHSEIKIRKDLFYFFQNKVVYIENKRKCIEVKVDYSIFNSMIKIKGFQSCQKF